MNLAIRRIEGDIKLGNSYWNDKFKDLYADYIITNPPFNDKDWGIERVQGDVRLKFGTPPATNANYMWIQHYIHHLVPNGTAGFVMANGSMSIGGVEGKIRKRIIEADLVDCIIALPPQLFYTTSIPACLWFITKNKSQKGLRPRDRETLFINARKMGVMIDKTHRELTIEEIKKIADTYHSYRGEKIEYRYEDIKGFCKITTIDEIKEYDYVLTPNRYIELAETEDDKIPFEDKMKNLTSELAKQFVCSDELNKKIKSNLREIGYEL